MEHGLLCCSKKIGVVFSRNSAGTPAEYEYGRQVLYTLSNTAIVAHATCLRNIAHTHHTRVCNAHTRMVVVHTNLLCDC